MRQILEITLMNLRSLRYRVASSLVVCVGIGGVVAVLVSVLAMATGLSDTLNSSGKDDRAIVLRDGALTESLSSVSREATLAIETAPAIAVDADGARLISPEVVVNVNVPRIDTGIRRAIPVRGLTGMWRAVRPEIDLLEGRYFETGLHEVVVGKMAHQQFRGLDVGDTVSFHGADWSVVGVFASNGDAHETELLTDAATLMSASNRTVFSAVTVVLADADRLGEFEEALEANPQLKVDVRRESEYYEGQSEFISQLLFLVAYVVGSIMALGALFGALNTMYTAVSARTVEIATLRAVGFGASSVVVSVLIEALALALIGALAGASIAWGLFNGDAMSMGGGIAQVALQLSVGPELFVVGIVWACAIGFIGGLFPAVMAARLPVAEGLRVVV